MADIGKIVFSTFLKSKSQALSELFPQILNIFSVKKLDNYISACNHLAGQVLMWGLEPFHTGLPGDWLVWSDGGFLLVNSL